MSDGDLVIEEVEVADELKAQRDELLAASKMLDAYWSEDFPGGPNSAAAREQFTDDVLRVWSAARAAIARAESRP